MSTTTSATDDVRYMKMALDEAAKAYAQGEVPVGAVVVCKGRVIARAHNLTETLTDVTAHAEMQAVTAAANDYLKCKVVNLSRRGVDRSGYLTVSGSNDSLDVACLKSVFKILFKKLIGCGDRNSTDIM